MTLDEYLKNQNGGSKSATPSSSKSYNYLAEAQQLRDIKPAKENISAKYERQHETRAKDTYSRPGATTTMSETMPTVVNPEVVAQTSDAIPAVEEPQKQSAWKNFWTTLFNVASGVNPTASSNISAGYNQAAQNNVAETIKNDVDFSNYVKTERPKELAEFDAKDTSPILFKGNGYNITQAKLDLWKNSDYRMSDEEKKQAKEYAKYLDSEVKKDSREHIFDTNGLDYNTKLQMIQDRDLLNTKTSGARQFAYGFMNELPGVKPGQKLLAANIDKLNGNTDASDYIENYYNNAQGAYYTAGKTASKISQYAALNASGALAPVQKGFSVLTAQLGPEIGTHAANILADQVADTVLDVIPTVLDQYQEGMTFDEIMKIAIDSEGENFVFNLLGEYAPQIIKGTLDNIKKTEGEQAAKLAEQMFKDNPDALNQTLDNIVKFYKNNDTAIKAAAKNADEAVEPVAKEIDGVKPVESPEIETLAKQTDNLPSQEIDAVKGQNEGQMTIDDFINSTKDAPEVATPEAKELDELTGSGDLKERGMSEHIRSIDDVTVATPMKVEGVSDEVVSDFVDNPALYRTLKNADTKALAEEIYQSGDDTIKIGDKVYTGNVETKFRTLLSEKNPASLPLGHQLAKDYSAAGNHEMAAQIYRDMGQELTKAGQFSQAAIINMVRDDPLTALQYAEKQLQKINEQGAKKFGKKWQNLTLTADEIKAFNSIEPGNADAIKALYDQIGARLGKEYPTTFMEKLLEGRKVAMLFNVRTNVRNFVANAPTMGMRWTADRVEALGQNIAHLIDPNFKVTQSVTGSGVNGRKLATEVYNSPKVKALLEGNVGKYELPELQNSLMKDRQMFKGTAVERWIDKVSGDAINKAAKFLNDANIVKNNVNVDGGIQALNKKLFKKEGVQSGLETIRNTTYKALDLGDKPFVKENFVERLGSYIKAQGIKNIDDIPDDAIELAWEEAMKATYKDNSWAVNAVRGFKKGFESIPVVGKPISQAAVPFVQAPGNIAARMVDYSPIRGTKGVIDIISGARKGDQELIRKGIEEFSKGATGTGMVVLGMKLKQAGIITGNYSEDKDQKNFEKQNGFRPWALHVKNKYFTFDWMEPFAQNLMVGVLIQEAIDNSDKEDKSIMAQIGSTALEGTKAAINSWFDESPLQSMKDLFKTDYNGKVDIAQNLIDVGAGNFAGGFVPATVNAIAKTEDTTQRNYYDPSSLTKSYLNQQATKIPGLSEKLPAKYDTWGNEIKYADNKAEAFAQRFLIPGDYGTEKDDPINDEVNRLFESTSDAGVFPLTAANKVGDTTLNNKQVSEYQKDMGERSRAVVEAIVDSDLYQNVDDATKAEMLKQIYGMSKAVTERDLFDKVVSNSSSYKKIIAAYDEGGVQGVADFLKETYALSSNGLATTNKTAQEAYAQGGQEALNAYTGVSAEDRRASQEVTAQEIPGLDYNQILKSTSDDVNAKQYVDWATAIPYLKELGVGDEKAGEILYNSGMRSDGEVKAYKDMGGYKGVYDYYNIQSEAASLRKDGSDKAMDTYELAAYLYGLYGYDLDLYNKWMDVYGKAQKTDKEYISNLKKMGINVSQPQAEIPQVAAPKSNTTSAPTGTMDLPTYQKYYGNGR